jgi:hypothetical protein
LYLANSLAAAECELALIRLLTFHVPYLKSLFRCLVHTKASILTRGKCSCFVTKPVFMVRSCQQLTQPPSWRTTPCGRFSTAYNIYLQLPSGSLRNQRTGHAVVTGTPLSRPLPQGQLYISQRVKPNKNTICYSMWQVKNLSCILFEYIIKVEYFYDRCLQIYISLPGRIQPWGFILKRRQQSTTTSLTIVVVTASLVCSWIQQLTLVSVYSF